MKSLPTAKIAQLDAIGFKRILVDSPPRMMWEDRYRELLLYKNKYGHCNVPTKWKENKSLGYWVENQRKRCRGAKGRNPLSKEQIDKLDSIGFNWPPGCRIQDEVDHRNSEGIPAIDEGDKKRVVAI